MTETADGIGGSSSARGPNPPSLGYPPPVETYDDPPPASDGPADSTPGAPSQADTSPFRRRWLRGRAEALWLLFTALLVRAATAWLDPALLRDGVDLLSAARRLGADGWAAVTEIHHHPLPPALIAWASRWWEPDLAATAIGVICGSLAVLPLHTLTRRTCGRHAALAAGLLYACLPRMAHVSSTPLAEGVFVWATAAALSLGVAAAGRPRAHWATLFGIGAGLFAAAAYLSRPEGLFIGALVCLAPLTSARSRLGRRWWLVAVVALSFALPSAAYVHQLSSGAEAAVVLSPKKDLARFAGARSTPLEAREGGVPVTEALASTGEALGEALSWVGLALAVLGLIAFRRWRNSRCRTTRLLLLAGTAGFLALLLRLRVGWGYGGARHALSAALLLLPFAGEGVLVLGGYIRRVTSRRRFGFVVTALLVMPLAARAVLRPPGESGAPARALGERLAEVARLDEPLVIASFGEPRIAHYAARERDDRRATDVRLVGRFRRSVLLVGGADDEARAALAEALRAEEVDYLVLDPYREHRDLPGSPRMGQELAERLLADGVLRLPVVAAGGRIVAYPVVR